MQYYVYEMKSPDLGTIWYLYDLSSLRNHLDQDNNVVG